MQAFKLPMVRILCLFILGLSLGISPLWAVKKASIVICAETGAVHHESNADVITHPASLTKMMTLYMTFTALRNKTLTLDQKLPVSKLSSQQGPCKLWLKPGTTITVRDAILGMITKSANDAAVALAETLGGSEARFAVLMTQQARKLGMTQTVFKNASGLPDKGLKQVTTARDMATLSRALYKHFPEYFPLFKTQKFAYKGVVHGNHNKLLGKIPGVDGIKTGFINAAGFNLATSCVRNGKRIIAVVMGGESAALRDKKMAKLLDTTHTYLAKGGDPIAQKEAYASLDTLIHTLNSAKKKGKSLVQGTTKIKKAAYSPSAKKPKIKQVKYQSVEHLIEGISKTKTPIKKKSSSQKGKIVKVVKTQPKGKKQTTKKSKPSSKSKAKK